MSNVSHISVLFAILIVMTRLVSLIIYWYVEAWRERARARSLRVLLAMVRPGTTVIERNADGSMVVVAASGGGRAPRISPAGENRKERR
jgi:hypothetical protein